MPTAIDRLTPDSDESQLKAAISDCVATEVKAGKPQEQAVAMCMEMARRATGKGEAPPAGGE